MSRAKTKSKPASKAKKVPVQSETSLVLRVCAANMTSSHEFKWPAVGEVATAPDWRATKECGNGLHGWLYGAGDHDCTNYHQQQDAKWLVVEVDTASLIQLGGKVKFPYCTVRFVGSRKDATDYLLANEPRALNVAVIGAQRQVGDKESVMVGALGTATAGYSGTATAGNYGTATAGDSGTATAWDSGTATAGDSGTATAGNYGTATAGNYGTATAGYSGTATAGDSGTATAGNYGTATAGEFGEIRVRWWDEKNSRYRTVIGYVGEDGIKPKVAYKLDADHKFVEAKP